MNQRLQLLNRRRNTVLLARHTRVVSMRHVPHQYVIQNVHTKKAVKTKYEVETPIIEETQVEVVKETKKESILVEKKPNKKKTNKKNLKAKRKAQKLKDKEDALNRLIDEPTTSIFLLITNPILCIEKVGTVDYATLSAGQRVVLNIVKWIVFSACIASVISGYINIDPFGFARLNFTASANLAFKIALYAFVFEILIVYLIYYLCNSRKNPIDRARMCSVVSIATPFKIVLFVFSAIVLQSNVGIGTAMFIASCLICFMLTAFGLSKTKLPPRRCLLAIFIGLVIAFALFIPYFNFVAKDVVNIFMNILNI